VTYDEFLERLPQTPRDWTVDEDGYLRRPHGGGLWECPVSALNQAEACCFRSAGEALGLDPTVVGTIVNAADYDEDCSEQIRADLLQATGLA
jgi:hypothetical protein